MSTKIKITLPTIILSFFFLLVANFALAQSENNLIVEFETTPLFSQVNFLPGEGVNKWAKVTNQSDQGQTLGIQLVNYSDADGLGNWLNLEIKQNSATLYNNTLANLAQAGETNLGSIPNNQTIQYDFVATFNPETSNGFQGKTLGFDIVLGYLGENDNGGNGGDGGGPVYAGYLRYVYPQGKINASSVQEWVTLYNKTRNVLYPGVIKIDIPEEYLNFVSAQPAWDVLDQASGQASWSTPLLGANGTFHILFTLETLQPGDNLITHVYFDNQHVHLSETGQETIKPQVTEQAKDKWSFGNPAGGGLVAGVEDFKLADNSSIQSNPNLPLGKYQDTNFLVEAMLDDYQNSSGYRVLGEATDTSAGADVSELIDQPFRRNFSFNNLKDYLADEFSCQWWVWLIIILLYLFIAYLYTYCVTRQKWTWLAPAIVLLIVIYWLFSLQCGASKTVSVVINLSYLVSLVYLARHYINDLTTQIVKVKKGLILEVAILSFIISIVIFILGLFIYIVF